MAQFIDKHGDRWQIKIDLPAVLRLREELGVDLFKGDMQQFRDPILFADVVALLCRPAILSGGITGEEFLQRLDAAALESAGKAFTESLTAFYPDPPKSKKGKNRDPVDLWTLCDEWGGVLGLDVFAMPGMTLRRLQAMYIGRERAAWNRTSELYALIYNANRDPKKTQPLKPWEYNPYGIKPPEAEPVKVPFETFAQALWGMPRRPKEQPFRGKDKSQMKDATK